MKTNIMFMNLFKLNKDTFINSSVKPLIENVYDIY